MIDVDYLVVGGGMTADAAVKAVVRAHPGATVLVVSEEPDAPYKRPPLSKGLWKGDDPERASLRTADSGARLLLDERAQSLDVGSRTVTTSSSQEVRYGRLLLATGARPRVLGVLPPSKRVVYYRTLADYRAVKAMVRPGADVLVVGGGFLGCELAAAMTLAGARVSMLFPEEQLGAGRFPATVAGLLRDDYQRRGVTVLPGRTVAEANEGADAVSIVLDDGSALTVDLVLVGAGTVANDELASGAGLLTADGIVVNGLLRASGSSGALDTVYAAGDVARFDWNPLGRRMRIEHEDNAYNMGAAAGRFMVAAALGSSTTDPYTHLPFFYSDLFDNGYEAVGVLDARLQTVEDWRVPGREGVVYYLDGGRVRGVLLWNTWGQVDAARDLIKAGEFAPEQLMGRLPEDD